MNQHPGTGGRTSLGRMIEAEFRSLHQRPAASAREHSGDRRRHSAPIAIEASAVRDLDAIEAKSNAEPVTSAPPLLAAPTRNAPPSSAPLAYSSAASSSRMKPNLAARWVASSIRTIQTVERVDQRAISATGSGSPAR